MPRSRRRARRSTAGTRCCAIWPTCRPIPARCRTRCSPRSPTTSIRPRRLPSSRAWPTLHANPQTRKASKTQRSPCSARANSWACCRTTRSNGSRARMIRSTPHGWSACSPSARKRANAATSPLRTASATNSPPRVSSSRMARKVRAGRWRKPMNAQPDIAASESAQAAQDAIAEEFAFFGDWTERYQYLIDLGRKLPPFPDELKRDEFKVSGCQSQVWLVPGGDAQRLTFQAISDSAIVSGLIALLLRVYSGRSAQEILATEPRYIAEIGLAQHLSPTRSNG